MFFRWSEQEIRSVLRELNIPIASENLEYCFISCPFHSEKDASFKIDFDKDGVCHCHGCGYGSTFTQFVYKYDNTRAKNIIGAYQKQDGYRFKRISEKKKKEIFNKIYTERELSMYDTDDWSYSVGRGIPEWVCKKFRVGKIMNEITFPIHYKGQCIAVGKRNEDKKRFMLPKGWVKSVCYLDQAEEWCSKNISRAVVCEGVYNALTCWAYGIPAVWLAGTGTPIQRQQLVDSSIKEFVLAFDNDEAGLKGERETIEAFEYKKLVRVCRLPEKEDVNDLIKDQDGTRFMYYVGDEFWCDKK